MKRVFKLIILLLLLLGLSGAMIYFSPFGRHTGFDYPLVIHETEINAPPDSVFAFLGRSSNAVYWSSYVNHITTLNSAAVKDGEPGSERRCFKNADEKGITWDERISVVEKNTRRQLLIYNLRGFSLMASDLATEQIYIRASAGKTKLAFTLFFKHNRPSKSELLKTYLAAYFVKSIYEKNLSNIKTIIESGKLSPVPYPYE